MTARMYEQTARTSRETAQICVRINGISMLTRRTPGATRPISEPIIGTWRGTKLTSERTVGT
jgi:hypothetical protein